MMPKIFVNYFVINFKRKMSGKKNKKIKKNIFKKDGYLRGVKIIKISKEFYGIINTITVTIIKFYFDASNLMRPTLRY